MTKDDKILQMLETITTQLQEHGAILGALQHASEVHKADIDNLTIAVAEMLGETKRKLVPLEANVADHETRIQVLEAK